MERAEEGGGGLDLPPELGDGDLSSTSWRVAYAPHRIRFPYSSTSQRRPSSARTMRWLFSLLLLGLLGLAQALSYTGNRLLVVLEEAAEKDKYSTFWADLTCKCSPRILSWLQKSLTTLPTATARGFSLTFSSPKDEKLALFKHGERAFDHVILLPPKSKGLGPNLSPQTIVEFINAEGNILMALSGESATPTAIQSLLLEFDIHLSPDRNSLVLDHFNYDKVSAADKHDVLVLDRPQEYKKGVKSFFGGDGVVAVPRAVGQVLGNENPMLAPILSAPDTAYPYNPKEEAEGVDDPFAVGTQLTLVTAFQARNSARFTVLGSVEMLQNQWFDASVKRGGKEEKAANREFAKQITAWTFKEVGVLKVGRLQHWLNEGAVKGGINETGLDVPEHNPKIYRIKNDVVSCVKRIGMDVNSQYAVFRD